MCPVCGGVFDIADGLPAPTPARIVTDKNAGLCAKCQAERDLWPTG
jgi:hypothetical protein